jgi:phenylacetate-CoA ligase
MYHAKNIVDWPAEIVIMKKVLRKKRSEFSRLRFNLLKNQLVRAYEDVSFYHDAFVQHGLNPHKFRNMEEFTEYPIINRQEIQQNFSRFISKKVSINDLNKSHSSGSTGRPLWTYFDRKAWVRKKYFSKLRARMECGLKPGEKIAVFDTDPPSALEKRNKQIIFSNPALKTRYVSIFDSPRKNLQDLIRFCPQNVDSIPSHLFQLAMVMKEDKIKLRSIKRIFTSSEYLEPNMRQFIQQTFDAELFDIYGCTEIKEVAWECQNHSGYHINEDDVLLEILNDSVPAKPGEVGEIVLTDLRNRAMPLIRYRLGDLGMFLPGTCSCGRVFSLMLPAAGRSSEYVTTPSGKTISPYRFTTAIEKTPGLLQYQFIQDSTNLLIIKVIMNENERRDMMKEIQAKIQSVIGEDMTIQVVMCDKIDIEENGKYKVVKNNIIKL